MASIVDGRAAVLKKKLIDDTDSSDDGSNISKSLLVPPTAVSVEGSDRKQPPAKQNEDDSGSIAVYCGKDMKRNLVNQLRLENLL